MWRTLVGIRSLNRGFARGGNRFFSSNQPKPKKPAGLKALAKEYGWTATGVYVALSFVDLPLSYFLVHSAGQERMEDCEIACRKLIGAAHDRESTYIHKAGAGGKSLFLAELGIAYIIHKCFIVVRVPLTVAITPAIATKLGKWGFNVKRAMPTVDKNQLAAKVASKVEGSNSATIRRAADILAKDSKKPVSDILKDAAKAGNGSDAIKSTANKIKQDASSHNFGQQPSQKRRWWWFM